VLIDAVKDTPEGQAFIANCSRWNDAVHQKDRRPLTIFSTLSFHHGQPEVRADTPFAKLIAPFATFENGSPETQIDSCFKLDGKDILLHKKRWSATTGSSLEQILKAKGIDTVIIVCASCPLLKLANRNAIVWFDPFRCRDEHSLSIV
jgi:nicotinamidase-related amidase